MEDWVGFTDEELRRLKHQDTARKDATSSRTQGSRQQKRTKLQSRQRSSKTKPENVEPAMMLAEKTTQPAEMSNVQATDGEEKPVGKPSVNQDSSAANEPQNTEKILGKELDEKEFVQRELSNAEKFQMQQKIMEEQNKKKQQLLAMAIGERQKKAKAEASKLIKIQRELANLDRILHADVTIIRDKIEEASRDFLEAQKRYDKAEAEFIDAKIDLHRKSDIKESMTEHLYTIIHQNELRKATKLTELMEKLQLEGSEEASPVHIDLSGLPSMTLLNAVQTLESGSPLSSPTNLGFLQERLTAEETNTTQTTDKKTTGSDQALTKSTLCNPGSSVVEVNSSSELGVTDCNKTDDSATNAADTGSTVQGEKEPNVDSGTKDHNENIELDRQ